MVKKNLQELKLFFDFVSLYSYLGRFVEESTITELTFGLDTDGNIG